MQSWYNGMTDKQRKLVWIIAFVLLFPFIPIGLVALAVLLYLHYGRS